MVLLSRLWRGTTWSGKIQVRGRLDLATFEDVTLEAVAHRFSAVPLSTPEPSLRGDPTVASGYGVARYYCSVNKTSPAARLIVVGAGAHAKVVIEAIRAARCGEVVGLVDSSPAAGPLFGVPVLGGDEILPQLRAGGLNMAVVAIGHNAVRERISTELRRMGFILPSIIHPSAVISPSAHVNEGVVIMVRAVVGTDSIIEDFAIINTSASIDHDNRVGVAAHVAPGCALAGRVQIGARALVGVGSAVRPGIQIGIGAVVGAGSSVVADVPDGAVVGGAPARPLRRAVP